MKTVQKLVCFLLGFIVAIISRDVMEGLELRAAAEGGLIILWFAVFWNHEVVQ